VTEAVQTVHASIQTFQTQSIHLQSYQVLLVRKNAIHFNSEVKVMSNFNLCLQVRAGISFFQTLGLQEC